MKNKSEKEIEKSTPKDINTEEILLGTIIKKPDVFGKIYENLKPEYFYKLIHKKVFKAIIFLYLKNKEINAHSLAKILKEKNKIKNAEEIIKNLSSKGRDTTNLEYEAEILREMATKRAIISAGKKLINLGSDNSSAADNIETAQKLIDEIAFQNTTDESEEISDVMLKAYEEIENKYIHKDELIGYSTGFKDLDEILGGLRASNLIIIGARPAMGKTAFALNIAQNIANIEKIPVVIFSLEMNKTEVVKRMLSMEGEIDLQRIKSGNLEKRDWEKFAKAMEETEDKKIYIDDTCDGTFSNLRAKCHQLKNKEKDLGLIIIDYLQLIDCTASNKRKQPYSAIIRGLSATAKELNLPVIVLTTLPRTVDNRKYKRPMQSDMNKYFGNISKCDIIMFIYRDSYYNFNDGLRTKKERKAEIIVAKNKNGQVGTSELEYNIITGKFKDIKNNFSQKEMIMQTFDGKEL